jgi:hypothetical protein
MLGEYSKHHALPFTAASDIVPYKPVLLDTGSAKRQVVPLATNNVEPVGIVGPATALRGEAVTVYGEGAVVEAICVASIGAGQDVAGASTNGALGLVAGASGVTRYRVARTLEAAGAGERFSVYVSPKQLSNLI